MAKKESKSKDITFKIKKVYGYLGDEEYIYAKISWNGEDAHDEIRRCWRNADGELKLGKGIKLSKKQIDKLYELKNKAVQEENGNAFDFDSVFKSSEGITDKRKAGNMTDNGFIVLCTKPGVDLKERLK